MKNNKIIIFALEGSNTLGESIAKNLQMEVAKPEERNFVNGEHKIRPLVNVRNKHIYVIHSLYSDKTSSVNDKLCKLLFFTGALKDAKAKHVSIIAPYLCYTRKDRKTKSRDPITNRYIAQLFEAMGCDHFVTVDVHNLQAYDNAFRCPTDRLSAQPLFVDYIIDNIGIDNIAVMSPDIGGVKRAEQLRTLLAQKTDQKIPFIYMEKQRSEGVVTGDLMAGNTENKKVIIIDDLMSSGETMVRAAKACKKNGANTIYAFATHGLFTAGAQHLFDCDEINQVIVTNSVTSPQIDWQKQHSKLTILDIAPMLAQAIESFFTGNTIQGE